MKAVLPIAATVTVTLISPLAAQTRLLREPTVSRTQIAFSYANDIWVVARSGGDATRVTTFPGTEAHPQFSPDGAHIAFTAEYDGNTDVYIVSAQGGEPTRLTWHPGDDLVRGWTSDGRSVIFASDRTGAPVPYERLWTMSVDGGQAQPMAMPRAFAGSPAPTGAQFAYQQLPPPNTQWRNYRGGQTQPIRLIDLDDYDEVTVPWDNSNDLDPVWVGTTLYFLSDRDWAQNVYAYDTNAQRLRQITTFSEYDVKSLDAGGGAVVFEQAGRIHLYDPAADQTTPVNIRVRGDFPWLRPHWEDVGQMAGNAALSPTGVRAVFEARGDILTVPTDKGDYRNLTETPGVADRAPAWSADGKWISWFSDAGGEYQLMIASQDGLAPARSIPLPNPTFYYTPRWSPDSKHIVFTDADLNLSYATVETGRVTRIDTDQFAHPVRTVDPVWSPDSKWIAYAKRMDNQFHAIMAYSLETGRAHQLTDGLSDAISPAWDAGGKYLYFLASTNYALNSGWLDMSNFERPIRRGVYFAVLDAEEPSPLLPQSDEEETSDQAEVADSTDTAVRLDLENIGQRILALDVPERDYQRIVPGPEGVVFYTEAIPNQQGATVHRYSLEEREGKEFLKGVQNVTTSSDGKKLLYRAGTQWGVVETDTGTKSVGDGSLDMNLSMRVDPRAEWDQMFREAWRFQRDYLYVENTHGADWEAVWARYEPWVEDVAHRSDFTYLLQNLAGELSIGHSFTFGGDTPDVESVPVGLLGADFDVENGRYRIARIYSGENWNPDLRAPLSAPGIAVSVGDYVLAVNGDEVMGTDNIYRHLEGTANRQTVLTVNARPTMDGARHVTVVPVPSETQLRMRAWVEDNRRKVDEMSDGRLAYVWLPNTSVAGYTFFNRYYFAQQHKQGAIVDERFNGGGSAADYMVDIMGRRLTGFFNNAVEDRQPFTNPGAGIWGPKVMIVNEAAGSGGDLLPYMFRELQIGPLVGTRTWGGLVGIWDVPPLIDGGLITAPRGGFYNLSGEWDVENVGVAPDIEVEQTAKDVIAGHDPQLERAVQEGLRLLDGGAAVAILPEPDAPVRVRRPDQRATGGSSNNRN
jgi:tricorn protease